MCCLAHAILIVTAVGGFTVYRQGSTLELTLTIGEQIQSGQK